MEKRKRMIKSKRRIYLREWIRYSKFAGTEGAREDKLVALSFDDGPHPDNTPRVIEILKENRIRATFFWIVENAINLSYSHPIIFKKILSEIKNNGYEVGLHAPNDLKPTIYSRFFGHFTKQELGEAKKKLETLTKTDVNLYRPHYLQLGSGIIHANQLGMTTVLGNLLKVVRPDGQIRSQVKTLSQAGAGNIIILHDGQNNQQGKNRILDVLPECVRLLKNKGLKPTSVSKVLEN